MKRDIIVAVFVALAIAGGWAQSATVTLQNQEEATFLFVVDPPSLEGLSAGSPLLATKVAAFFAESKSEPAFASLSSGTEAHLENLPDGTHLLVGVFATEGETDLPVRVISVEADSRSGERFYAIFATPSQLTVTRGIGRLAALIPAATTTAATTTAATTTAATTTAATTTAATTTAATTTAATTTAATTTAATTTAATTTAATTTAATTTAATTTAATTTAATTTAATTTAATTTAATTTAATTTAATTTAVASAPAQAPRLGQIASFVSYDPVTFTKEKQGDFKVLAISDSRGWKLTGTRMTGLSGVIDPAGLHIALSVPGGFSENVSYFFYIFAQRAAGKTNDMTLELLPRADGSRGACLLWWKGSAAPRLIGSVQSTATSVELDVGADELAAFLTGTTPDTVTIDVTSGWYDRSLGTWEEFYYTTISVSQIPSTD